MLTQAMNKAIKALCKRWSITDAPPIYVNAFNLEPICYWLYCKGVKAEDVDIVRQMYRLLRNRSR